MAQIHILSKETIDKIAAGEVVERPSSIVKELLENAVDAGASAVTVEIKEGGISFIRVTDNGCGIDKEQVPLAFLRHATSKIHTAEDLSHIISLGFRGEALSSIAAVSRMELMTKTKGALTGTRYLIEGGEEVETEEIGAPDGTTIIVRNLFFNTPVRKKFLKHPQTEGGYISDLMEHMAMSHPQISFKYMNNGQLRFHTSGNGNLQEIIYRIYGKDVSNALVPIDSEGQGIHMYGFLGKPEINRANRNFEIYFVNGRFIKSSLISKAIEEGYRKYVMQHKFPFAVLHFEINSGEIDVNVHPTKMEIRFTNRMKLYDFIESHIRQTLHSIELIPEVTWGDEKEKKKDNQAFTAKTVPEPFETVRSRKKGIPFAFGEDIKGITSVSEKAFSHRIPPTPEKPKTVAEDGAYRAETEEEDVFFIDNRKKEPLEVGNHGTVPNVGTGTTSVMPKVNGNENIFGISKGQFVEMEEKTVQTAENFIQMTKQLTQGENLNQMTENPIQTAKNPAFTQMADPPTQMNFFEEKMLTKESRKEYRILGQIFDTYWLVAFHDKLFIIDQHAAHEKVKYERLMARLEEKQVSAQMLNPPIVVTLSGKEESVCKEYMEFFMEMGFELESFGGNEYFIRSVPADLYGCNGGSFFTELLDELSEGPVKGAPNVIRQKIASMACKAAVKGNMAFDALGMEALIDELLTLKDPYHCPHGRPTIISMSKYELEKKFKRIV